MPRPYKRRADPGPQQVTRIPPYRPGMWVKLQRLPECTFPRGCECGLCEKVLPVTALTGSYHPRPLGMVWRVHFAGGRSREWHGVERLATDVEVRAVEQRRSSMR
jgi:hypothetical protein